MAFLQVDDTKCRRDGICAAECPRRIIDVPEDGGVPVVATEHEGLCLRCGHCVVVCPHAAVSLGEVPLAACPEIDPTLTFSTEAAVQFLRSRRSIRVYRDEGVGRSTVQRLIDVARYAPTASNSQLVRWTVLSGREKLRRISALTVDCIRELLPGEANPQRAGLLRSVVESWERGYDGILRDAPTLVVAAAPRDASNGLVDCTIALTYLELAALSLGLGTCWAGLLQLGLLHSVAIRGAVGLHATDGAHYPMMLGYPAFTYHRLPERREPAIVWE